MVVAQQEAAAVACVVAETETVVAAMAAALVAGKRAAGTMARAVEAMEAAGMVASLVVEVTEEDATARVRSVPEMAVASMVAGTAAATGAGGCTVV